jgi:Ca2+-binding RTX toxin-like protein
MCAALLVFAPGAVGATVALSGATITYTAAPGEVNDLTVDQTGGNITFDEAAINITDGDGGAGCTVAAGNAACPEGGVTRVVIDAGDQDDSCTASSNNIAVPITVTLGDGADFVSGTKNGDSLDGGAGPDQIDGNSGADVIDGGAGADDLNGDGDNDQVNGGLGADRVRGGSGNDTLHGDQGSDDLDGDNGDDQLFGDAGNDFFVNDAGADAFNGGDGRDFLDSFDEADQSWMQDGVANDGAAGEGDNWGGDVEDLSLGDGDNVVAAGPGDNRIDTGDGSDVIDGGAGSDQIDTRDGDDVVQGGDGADDIGSSSGNDFLDGGPGGDRLFGGDGNDTLHGGADADELSGGADADTLDGGNGTDFLYGGDGADAIGGGADVDTVDFTFEVQSVFVSIDGVANDGFAGEGDNVLADVENIIGGSADDVLGGSAVTNSIDGGPGNDAIAVRDTSADEVTCGAGLDSVVADALDSIDPFLGSCENVDRGVVAALGRRLGRSGVSVRKGRARIGVVCPLDAIGGCAGVARLKRSGRSAGSASFLTPAATRKTVSIKLPKGVARLIARGRRVKVTLTITGSDLRGPLRTFQGTLTLKR